MKEHCSKVKIWKKSNGEIFQTIFLKEGLLPNETEDEFIERISKIIREADPLISGEEVLMDLEEWRKNTDINVRKKIS